MLIRLLLLIAILLVPVFGLAGEQDNPTDKAALQSLDTGKAVFDVRTDSAGRLLFTLKVIERTAEGMAKQGVNPDFIVTFRGKTLPMLRAEPKTPNDADRAMLSEVRERLAEMKKRGWVLEACNVAASVLKVDERELSDDVTLVGNSLISLIGYQNRGYALVPMY